MNESTTFEEVQDLPWPFTLLGLGGAAVGGMGAAARLGALGRLGAAGAAIAAAGVVAGAFLLPMRTTVRETEIEVTFGRWTRFRIPFARVVTAEARRYSPILEYGGWGIRFSGAGRAYNMRGNEGVQLVLDDGSRILIGSQRAQELATAIHARMGQPMTSPPPHEDGAISAQE